MIVSKDTHKHITIGHMTLFIPDHDLERYLLITTLANQFGLQTNTQAGLLLLEKIRVDEEGLLDQLTFEYDDGGIIVHSSEDQAEAILQVIFLAHDLMVPPYQMNLSNEEKNSAIEICRTWVRPKLFLPAVEGPYDHGLRPVANTVIDVIPGERIGKLYLGMSEKECSEVLESYRKEHLKGLWNYSLNDVFRIDYDQEGKISFIEMVTGYEPELLQVRIHLPEQTVEAFQTKANTLIPIIDRVSPYDRSEDHNGYAYYFKELGLALWRGNVFEEEQIEEAWFKEMCAENQQDELRFLYFETVSVMVPGYYKQA